MKKRSVLWEGFKPQQMYIASIMRRDSMPTEEELEQLATAMIDGEVEQAIRNKIDNTKKGGEKD